MKLKRILYCTLSLVLVLCFLPGCYEILGLPRPKPRKYPPCDVIPTEPPSEYGNFVAFRVDGVPYVYDHCYTSILTGTPFRKKLLIYLCDRVFHLDIPSYIRCDQRLPEISILLEFEIPYNYSLGSELDTKYVRWVQVEDANREWNVIIPDSLPKISVTSYDLEAGTCMGYFSAALSHTVQEGERSDTLHITDGVFSIMQSE